MGRIICTYNITVANESIKILNATGGVDNIYYNGNSIGVVQYYTFPTTGLHRLEFEESGIVRVGFANLDALVEVEIIGNEADLYTSVQEQLFYGCANLKKVTLPNNLKYIYTASFYNCKSLQTITIPSSTEKIYTSAFFGSGLEELIIEGCPNIELSAFAETNKLKTITCYSTTPPVITNTTFKLIAPNGTLNYPEGADYSSWLSTDGWYLGYYGWNTDNSSLLKCYYVWDGDGEVELFNETLTDYVNLIRIGTDTLTQEDGDLSNWYANWDWYDEESGYLVAYIRLNDMTTIPDYFFRYNAKLAKFEIPESITSLGKDVFYDTDKLNTIVCYSTTPPVINESSYGNTFRFINRNGTLYYPEGADYSSWLSTEQDYLGYYGWNGVEIEVDEPEVTTPYVTGTTTILYFNYDGTPKTSNEFDVYWYGDYYDRNIVNDSSHFGVSGRKIETTDEYVKYHYTVVCTPNNTNEIITGSCYFNIKLDASTYGESFVVEFRQDAKPEIPDVYINLEYNEITAPQGGITSTLDIETNGVEDIEIIAPDWVEVTDKGGYYEIEVLPNEDGYREGEVIFIGNPNNPNKVQQNIIITQKGNEEEMATSIALNKTRLDFAATGGTGYVQVDYVNAQSINAPYCSQSWVTIEQTQSGSTTTNGQPTKQVQYRITMQPSSFARQTNITFSCVGTNGNTVSQNKFMVYQAAPALALPTITLEKNSIEFDSTGYAENFSVTVTYADTDTVLEPVVNGDWITVTEGAPIQGGNTGSGTAIVKRYLIEVSETEAYRQGTIVFKASNANGTSNSSIFSVIQNAPVEDEEIVPVISAYTKTATVKYDGSSTGIAITSLGCSYKNVKTVLTPVVNGSWIHLGEGVLQSSLMEDTLVYRYPITFDTNSSVERIGYVTFKGTDEEGNEYTDITKITQQAAPVVPDEPEPDLPTDSKDETFAPIWKDVEYVFGGTDVTYGIYQDTTVRVGQQLITVEELLFKGRAYAKPDESTITVNINKICQNYLKESYLPFNGSVGVQNSISKFKLKNEWGTLLHTYTFINDWTYKELTLGVKTNPIVPYIGDGQKLFFSTLAQTEKMINWGMRYYDGTADYDNAEKISNDFNTVIVAPSREKGVSTFYFDDKSFKVLPKCKCKYVLYYLNPYGGYDWFPITGRVTRKDKLETYTITQNYNNTTTDFGKKRYLSTISINYQINTQWLTQAQSDRMWELMESNQVWLHNLEEDKVMPVIITNTDVEHKYKTNSKRLLSYQINVELSQNRERM